MTLPGTADISGYTAVAGIINFEGNGNMTEVINPTSAGVLTTYSVANGGINTALDMSGLTGLGGVVNLSNNSSMTSVTFPTSTVLITSLNCDNIGVTTIDMSGLNISGIFRSVGASSLTTITNPTNSNTFTVYSVVNCALVGTLDVSGLTGLGGVFNVFGNSGLTDVTMPASNTVLTAFGGQNCALGFITLGTWLATNDNVVINLTNNATNAGETNCILDDLDLTGWTGGTVTLTGTNAAPDSSSGGCDGDAAVVNLVADTWTVNTN